MAKAGHTQCVQTSWVTGMSYSGRSLLLKRFTTLLRFEVESTFTQCTEPNDVFVQPAIKNRLLATQTQLMTEYDKEVVVAVSAEKKMSHRSNSQIS